MGYIISFGYSQGAIWFYNLRAPQICFRNFWDQKIDQVETQDGCEVECWWKDPTQIFSTCWGNWNYNF